MKNQTNQGNYDDASAQESSASLSSKTSDSTEKKPVGNKKHSGKGIYDVFVDELKDIYGAEKQLIKALPDMVEAASTTELKNAFKNHLKQTEQQAKRIETVFGMLSIDREAKKCKAMEGLLEEGKAIIEDFDEGSTRDCALIIGAQKIEHYEIAAYGSLCELAEVMGKHRVAELLDQTLEEEESTDSLLTKIAESVNDLAMSEMEESVAIS